MIYKKISELNIEIIDGDRGVNYPKESDFSEDGYCLFLSAKNVTKEGLKFENCQYINSKKDLLLSQGKLIRNDIVLTTRGTVGNFAIYNNTVQYLHIRINSGMLILRNQDNQIDNSYIIHFFSSILFGQQIINIASGSAQPQLTVKTINDLKINFPESLSEQRKIAQILSTTDAVIEKTQAAIAKYKAIKQGMLHDLFTRGIDITTGKLRPKQQDAPELYKESTLGWIPKEWEINIFGEEIDLIHGHQFRDYDFTSTGIPIVKIGQVKPENVDLTNCSFIDFGREEEFKNEIILNGDVLMALTGATLGKACIVSGLNSIVLQNYRVGRFEPIIKEYDLEKRFLYYLLIAGELLTQIFSKVNSGAQGNIGKADFEKATFKKPHFIEQQIISGRLKSLDNKLQSEQTYLQKLQMLKSGLMNDLLSGKKELNLTDHT